jgi:hypothetical protein
MSDEKENKTQSELTDQDLNLVTGGDKSRREAGTSEAPNSHRVSFP